MKASKTQRGFGIIEFTDRYGLKCSLQDSSLATEPAIWFGVDNPEVIEFTNFPNLGPYKKIQLPENINISSRMHLTQSQVKELLPFLQRFAETGEYIAEMTDFKKKEG